MLKLVVIVVIAFAHCEKSKEERVAGAAFRGIRLPPNRVTCAVNQKSAMLQHNNARNARDQEPTERSNPAVPEKTKERWEAEADQNGDPVNMSILPADKLVLLKIGDVVVWLIGLQFEKQPADVRVKKAFRNAVRIVVMIDMFMMAPMLARPHQNRVFKSAGAKNKGEQPDRPACLEGNVREKPMIA